MLISSTPALAWHEGHESQADQIFRLLPPSFTGRFDKAQRQRFVEKYSHYPDYLRAKSLPEPAGEYFISVVRREKLNPHDTYKVLPHLVEALRANEEEQALMWAGCIVHSIGDTAALNHPDLIWFPDAMLGVTGVKTSSGKSIAEGFMPDKDYRQTYFDPKLQVLYDQQMADYQGQAFAADPQKALVHVLVRDRRRKEDLNYRRETYEAYLHKERYERDPTDANRLRLAKAFAELVVEANREILDTLVTAIAFAEAGRPQAFDVADAEKKARKILAHRDAKTSPQVRSMSVFTRLWHDTAPEGAIGVVVPDRKGHSGWKKQHWTLSMILRALQGAEQPYRCLTAYDQGLSLDVKQTPVLILVSTDFTISLSALDGTLEQFVRAGGKLLWIGGPVTKGVQNILPKARWRESDPQEGFVGRTPNHRPTVYRFPFPVFSEGPQATFIRSTDGREFPVRLPLDQLDWNRWGECRSLLFDVSDSPKSKALLRMVAPNTDAVVSVHTKVPGGGEVLYLPWFVLCPCTLAEHRTLDSAANIQLDAVGSEFLSKALRRLTRQSWSK